MPSSMHALAMPKQTWDAKSYLFDSMTSGICMCCMQKYRKYAIQTIGSQTMATSSSWLHDSLLYLSMHLSRIRLKLQLLNCGLDFGLHADESRQPKRL